MSALEAPAVPACMSPDELAMWAAGNGVTTGTRNGRRVYAGRAASPCDDCTLGYAADMRAIGRCDGRPGGVEEDDEMETPAVYAATTELRTRVTVVAPCATCIHARVCRLRPADELVVAASLPQLDAALTATLTATVECMEYAKAGASKAAKKPRTEAQLAAAVASAAKAREAMAAKRAAAKAEAAA